MIEWYLRRLKSSEVGNFISLTRITLVWIIFSGLSSYIYLLLISGTQFGDFQTYYAAAERSFNGKKFIGSGTGIPTGSFKYLPGVVIIYYPLLLLEEVSAYRLLFSVNTAILSGIGYLVVL